VLVTDAIAVLAGCAQAAAYGYYVRLAVSGTISPNPMSWLMFAYGTALVVIIETQSGASWHELLLPMVCAASSIGIAIMAWRQRDAATTLSTFDWTVFTADLTITVLYLMMWSATMRGELDSQQFALANAALLIGVNVTTVTSFLPLLKSALRDPTTEHPGPWVLWSFAYLMLLVATALNAKGPESALLLLYPALNFILHTDVAALVLPEKRTRHV
jgi:hypothetical protein